jgi:hypothetical protein
MNAVDEAVLNRPDAMGELSLIDEIELRAYFARYVPPAPGACSNFGSMCTRLGNARNLRSKERPSPGASWTEILDCSGARAGAKFDGEYAMVEYLDAQRRFRRVAEALPQLPPRYQDALAAYYGGERAEHALGQLAGVTALTPTALRRNRSRAARGLHEPIEATVRWLTAATTPDGSLALASLRSEAEGLLRSAQRAYVEAVAKRPLAAASGRPC